MADVVLRKESDPLHAEVWRFWFYREKLCLVLQEYHKEERASLRHKWRIKGWFDRTNQRDSSIKEDDAPLPIEVKEAALKQVILKLRVVKGKEINV